MEMLLGRHTAVRLRIRSKLQCFRAPYPLASDVPSLTSCYRGHYSDAVLSSLESQNDAEVEGITAKVKMLKDVSLAFDVSTATRMRRYSMSNNY